MRLGLTLLPSRHVPLTDLHHVALMAEDLGYHSLWIPETWGYDAVALLSSLAVRTRSIRLAAGVLPVYSRSAALIAQAARTLQELSDGRFILGLGTSGPRVVERWHGVPFTRPIERSREYIDVIRLALSGERVDYHGSTMALEQFRLSPPTDATVPIALAALGPRNVRLAGELADIWLPIFAGRGRMAPLFNHLDEGLRTARRAREDITVAAFIPAVVSPRSDRLLRQQLAYYIGGMGTFYADYLTRLGYGADVQTIRDRWVEGSRAAAVEAVSDRLLATCTLGNSVAQAEERLHGYRSDGVTLPIVSIPNGATTAEVNDTLRAFAPLL